MTTVPAPLAPRADARAPSGRLVRPRLGALSCAVLGLTLAGCAAPAARPATALRAFAPARGARTGPSAQEGAGSSTETRSGTPSGASPGQGGAPTGAEPEDGDDFYGDDRFVGPIQGYPVEERQIGTPIDIEADLARGFPKSGAIFGQKIPQGYYTWKERLYADTGVKLAFNATLVTQAATDVRDTNLLTGEPTDSVAAGWSMVLEGKWEVLNRGKDGQGSLTAALDWRQPIGDAALPSTWFLENGSLWGTDFTILEWDPWLSNLYWEQWATKDRFVARVGQQNAVQLIDFFRFKDGRSSFSNSEFTFPVASLPAPGPGFGAAFELWPQKDSPLYVVGTVNDLNFEVGENFAWSSAFSEKEFFYAVEVGYNWGDFPTDFDHLHLLLFYADETSSSPAGIPNAAGGGFKLRGSKQWGRTVGFGSYTFNDAEGGPFGFTLAQNAVTAGLAYLRPADIRGELALGLSWAQPFDGFDNSAPLFDGLRDQWGVETYWKMLLTPDLWLTPGVQFIVDPSFNTDVDSLAIATVKLHLFL